MHYSILYYINDRKVFKGFPYYTVKGEVKKIESNVKTKRGNRYKIDFVLLMCVLVLLSIGIIMILSASAPSALSETGNSYYYFNKQFLFAIFGIGLMLLISLIDYRYYISFYKIAYVVSVLILLLVCIPGLGVTVNGATRWINLGVTNLQPSEITKIGLILFFAGYLTNNRHRLNTVKYGFLIPLGYLIPPILILIFVQDHLSVVVVLVAVISIMMLMAGSKLRYFLLIGGASGGFLATALLTIAKFTGKGAFRITRISTFLDPWADPTGNGWQIVQSLYAIGSGGIFGVGLGNSKQKYLYIPEPHNDFIFSILAEELGLIGCITVILLFIIFIARGILAARKTKDMFGSLLAIGIVSLVAVQVLINIAVVTSSIPATGMPLPFFSYGGTALTILLCAVGVLLNISRNK